MPVYSYTCTNPECEIVREDDASMTSFKEHHPLCEECGSVCNYVYIPTVPQVAFKDGPSGGWPSKANHFKEYRRKQSEKMEKRQKDRYGHLSRDAVPNIGGVETGSWREAQFQALKERGPESAATYNSKILEEKKKDKKIKL